MKKMTVSQTSKPPERREGAGIVSLAGKRHIALICRMPVRHVFPARLCGGCVDKSQGNHAGRLQPDCTYLYGGGYCNSLGCFADDELSRSGKTVDESRAWLKRICLSWAIINGLGFIMAYITPFFADGKWTG